jgi:hypothetical protein
LFLFTIKSSPALKPYQPSVQWTLKIHSSEIKLPGREVGYSPLSSAEIRMRGTIHLCPLHGSMAYTEMLLVVRVEIIYFGSGLYYEVMANRTNIL